MTSIRLPVTAGLGLKAEHYRDCLESRADGLWVEVHPENYMVGGGPRLAWLEAIRRERPLSLHGVGASLGSQLDATHLTRLKQLADRYEPARISEHVAWCMWDGVYFGDLLPLPWTEEALTRLCDNIDRMQAALKRRILIENPSLYLPVAGEMSEIEFLAAAVRRTGCGLLLDINNVFVSAHNLGGDAESYLDDLPAEAVGEIHLAGHAPDINSDGGLLIDTHGAAIAEPVWALFRYFIERAGPRPTLIERDAAIPSFEALMSERNRAQALLVQPAPETGHAHA